MKFKKGEIVRVLSGTHKGRRAIVRGFYPPDPDYVRVLVGVEVMEMWKHDLERWPAVDLIAGIKPDEAEPDE